MKTRVHRFLKGLQKPWFWLLVVVLLGGVWLVFPMDKGPLLSPETPIRRDFALVVLPDTQYYSRDYPEIFKSQTRWIVDHRKEENIVFVTHLGDIVRSWNVVSEWRQADKAMGILDEKIPYGVLPGNHDSPKLFDLYFPVKRFENQSWYGGHYGDNNQNSYQFLNAGGMDFVIIHLEINPDQAIIDWASDVIANHPHHRAIVSTHDLLDFFGFRSKSGDKIFKTLSQHPNLFLMLGAHVPVEIRRTDTVDGRLIHQVMANYQNRVNGGNGWLRILRFVPEENKIFVRTYSPWLDQEEVDENSQFELEYEMLVNVIESNSDQ
jgi:hypothetical protein